MDAYYEGFESGSGEFSPGGWAIVSSGAIEGANCLEGDQMGATASLTKTLANDGYIYFYYHGNSLPYPCSMSGMHSTLTFLIDDVSQGTFSGGWQLKNFPVTSGTHTFKWKNVGHSTCGGSSWIDYMIITK